jgi:ubiquinone/menaquinone biosynthesis C-methylase UbiE
MASTSGNNSKYTQGHSDYTVSTHASRTAETDAAFLLPYIKKTDRILDVGCGPGTITIGLAKCASEGSTVGIDISSNVLQKAKALAAEAGMPSEGPGSIIFTEANVLQQLPYPDNSFDVVYASQVFGHFPPPDIPLRALAEIRRVLKTGGILATRDGAEQHFYPRHLDLDRLWVQRLSQGIYKDNPIKDPTGTMMPSLFRKAGFDVDSDRVRVGAGTTVYTGSQTRKWLAWRAFGQLREGDPFRQSWLDAGISENEIQETLDAIAKWAETEDAWFVSVQCEMLAWK